MLVKASSRVEKSTRSGAAGSSDAATNRRTVPSQLIRERLHRVARRPSIQRIRELARGHHLASCQSSGERETSPWQEARLGIRQGPSCRDVRERSRALLRGASGTNRRPTMSTGPGSSQPGRRPGRQRDSGKSRNAAGPRLPTPRRLCGESRLGRARMEHKRYPEAETLSSASQAVPTGCRTAPPSPGRKRTACRPGICPDSSQGRQCVSRALSS